MFQQRIKQLRLQHKMTQEQLGNKINVSKVSVSGYETGERRPDMETLEKIADVFSVSIDYLLGRSNDLGTQQEPLRNETLINKLERLLVQSKIEGKVYLDDAKTAYMEYDDILWLKTAYEKSIKKEND